METTRKQRPIPAMQEKGRRKDLPATLKFAQIEISKPFLPAEILASILDYVPPVDLICVARTSRRMREMVYDDTRWVRRLKQMDSWDDAQARSFAEKEARKRDAADIVKATDSGGFDVVDFNTTTSEDEKIKPNGARPSSPLDPLYALQSVCSVRGKAREEYGKVHTALNPFYEDIINAEIPTEALVFKTYTTPCHQALLLSQLLRFSKSDSSAGCTIRHKKISDAISVFESAALREFTNAYEGSNSDELMELYGKVLVSLNGGHAAVDLLVHHNHILARKSDFGYSAQCIDPSTGNASLGYVQSFLTRLMIAINEEISIINRSFPDGPVLPSPFLEKIGSDILHPFLTTLFDELHATNIVNYVQILPSTFSQSLKLVRQLEPIRSADSEEQFYETASRIVEAIFEPHVDLYLAEELDQFKKQSDAVVADWDRHLSEQAASTESLFMSNINRHADKRDFMTSFKKVLMAPVNLFPSFTKASEPKDGLDDPSSEITDTDKETLKSNRSSTFVSSPVVPHTPSVLPTTELTAKTAIMNARFEGIRSLFSIEVALSLVHFAKPSIERTAQFVKLKGEYGVAAKQQCEAIFISLLDILGRRHVITGFDKAVDRLSEYRPRKQGDQEKSGVEPLVTFIELVNVGDLILQMVDVFYEQELVGAGLTDPSDFLDPAVREKKKFEQKLDTLVAAGLNKGIDVLMEEVELILATRQAAGDFLPEIVDPAKTNVDIGPSEAANAVVDVISSHTSMLVGSTDRSTLDVFNQEIGLRLFAVLCKHLKCQLISLDGSIKWISDMNHYFSLIASTKNEGLLVYFAALRELSQIYLIHPSDAKELAAFIADNSRFHNIFRAEEVYEFATRRTDWHLVKGDVEKAMFGAGCNVM